jgi:uncharacterized membrane protein YhaH (DUF805 family)
MDYAWFLFRIEGRINRAKCWLATLIILCWMIFLGMLTVVVIKMFGDIKTFGFGINDVFRVLDPQSFHSLSSAELFPLLAKTVGTLLFAWVYAATSIKRLHDRDKAAGGWSRSSLFRVSTTSLRASSAISSRCNSSPLPRLFLACGASLKCIF